MDKDESEETPVFQKYNRLLHANLTGRRKVDILTVPFMKKYIEYAKERCRPVLTEEVSHFYLIFILLFIYLLF